jgi:hypothetical protein
MPLFGKSAETGKGRIPLREVDTLRQSGVSDKDIIKKLKSDGFSYQEIEKGMLQSLKQNITEEPSSEAEDMFKNQQRDESTELEDIYGKPEDPKEPSMDEMLAPGLSDADISPELAIEELVEGVVNEKWDIFEKELKKIRSDEDLLTRQLKQLESMTSASGKEARAAALERKVAEVEEKMGEIEARISGVEKAFKQFLPSLTDNIRSLSSMVKEMKSRVPLSGEETEEENE